VQDRQLFLQLLALKGLRLLMPGLKQLLKVETSAVERKVLF
jgi:hypothetical protein